MLTRRGLGRLFGGAAPAAGLAGSAWAVEALPVVGGASTFAEESAPPKPTPHRSGQGEATAMRLRQQSGGLQGALLKPEAAR